MTRGMQKFSIKSEMFRSEIILVENIFATIFGQKICIKLGERRFLRKSHKTYTFIIGFTLENFGFFDFQGKYFGQNTFRAEHFCFY